VWVTASVGHRRWKPLSLAVCLSVLFTQSPHQKEPTRRSRNNPIHPSPVVPLAWRIDVDAGVGRSRVWGTENMQKFSGAGQSPGPGPDKWLPDGSRHWFLGCWTNHVSQSIELTRSTASRKLTVTGRRGRDSIGGLFFVATAANRRFPCGLITELPSEREAGKDDVELEPKQGT
jgi:hypothetical protein